MSTEVLQSNQQLEWERRPFREIFRLAWPIAASTVSYSIMTLVDTIFVGRLGADALADVEFSSLSFMEYGFAPNFRRKAEAGALVYREHS